ncbi:MAG TPA: hypothetical protein VFY49_19045 [Myxococcota bacterium]|nr:hypothetical protein [Myxococcota bacterium]
MTTARKLTVSFAAALLGALSLGAESCSEFGFGSPLLYFHAPLFSQLSLPDGVQVELRLGRFVDPESLEVELDHQPLDVSTFHALPYRALGKTLDDLADGPHTLAARAKFDFFFIEFPVFAATGFDIADLDRPDECEILNNVHCLLPYPSSRFLVPDASSDTGYRTHFPTLTVPGLIGPPLDPTPLNVYDGFAPTAQVLVHLQGADPVASNASRLLPGAVQSPPYRDLRTHDARSLAPDSPTVLIDLDTGEHVLHWVELDDHARSNPARQVLFLRPAQSLVPGHHYAVAFRRMLDSSGKLVPVEATFRALRDRRPSTIPALESRRESFEDLFDALRHAGIPRHDLQLAFDFRVRSDKQLTERMLFMRDDALDWLASLAPGDISGFSTPVVTNFGNCSSPTQRIWRRVSGTFAGPNYMNGNINDPSQVVLLNVDAHRMPVRNGTFPFNYDVAVPCDVFRGERPGHPLMLGHGFFGRGADMVAAYVSGGFFGATTDVSYIAGATDWRGLSLGIPGPDSLSLLANVIGTPSTGHKFNNFNALPNRLKQGEVNTLVLSRMLASGFFNRLPAFQRTPGNPATGVFTPGTEAFYFGVSLGGIYGTMFAALNQDVIRHNVDVPGMNFSILQQRSTQFPLFLQLLQAVGLTDPMELAVVIQIQHEMWVSADPAAYVRHITGTVEPPLPGTPPKQLLMTVSWLDKQVSNQAQEILARSLGIPNLVGSIQERLVNIPDLDAGAAGLPSALAIYDTGYFDIFDPLHAPFLPPLANQIPSTKCDPHGVPRLTIPASVQQLNAFLRPGGSIFNFCDGVCDAGNVNERPTASCDPLL